MQQPLSTRSGLPSKPAGRKTWALAGCLSIILYFMAPPVHAYPDGITGYSGNPSTCSSCHFGGAYSGTASVSGSGTVVPSSTTAYTLSLASSAALDAGFNLSATGGTLNDTDANAHKSGSELTHDSPEALSGSAASWSFSWTAPATVNDYIFYFCINQVNRNRDGDLGNGIGENGDNPVCSSRQITVNTVPNAVNNTYNSIVEDSTGNCLSVLSNDTSGTSGNETGDSITIFSITPPNNGGTATVGDGSTCATSEIEYAPDTNFDGTETFTYTIRDVLDDEDTATVTVNLVAQNDAPVISGVADTNTYVEGTVSGTVIDNDITITDVDSTNCNQATVDISTGHQSAEDLLEYTGSLTNSFDSGTGTLTLSGAATCATYANELELVTYRNTSLNPNTATRTIVFQVRDSTNVLSNTDSTTMTVQAISTPPTLSGVDATPTYAEDANPGVIIDSTISISDPDSTNCNQATIDISTGHQSGEDLLEYTGAVSGITDSGYVVGTGTLTLTSSTTCADLETALENVRYRNTSDNPNTANRTIVFQVRDSSNTVSNTDSTTVGITATNDDPIATDDAYDVVVNATDLELDVLANDSDPDLDSLIISAASIVVSGGGSVVIGAPCTANTLCYTAPPNYAGTETISYTVRDPSLATDTGTVTISPSDVDSDTVPDFLDNCPNDANAGQQNNDGDSEGDACDTDDDNDGMPDTWENTYGLNPFNAADAALDSDSDGVNNLDEYLNGTDPTTDDVGPQITGVSDKTVNSTGYYTYVNLGTPKANDVIAGALAVTIGSVAGSTSQADAALSRFRPGRTTITYEATDLSANTTTRDQVIDVRPLATFGADIVAVEGNALAFDVTLNGGAVQYPVTIDYALSGTAAAADHDLAAGTLTINAGTSYSFNVNISNDGAPEGTETLVITLANPNNAVLGSKSTQTITIVSGNVAPVVSLAVTQGANNGPLVTQADGDVTVTPTATDANAGSSFTYLWSSTGNLLVPINGTSATTATFEFDPAALAETGLYTLTLAVTDDGSPAATTTSSVNLDIKATAVVLNAFDTDGDGVNDDAEGYQDADANGIPDYLDAYNQSGVTYLIANQTGSLTTSRYIETEPSYSLRKGAVAAFSGASGVLVSKSGVSSYASSMGGSASLGRDNLVNIGGIYDFEIYGVTPGDTVSIVLPVLAGILQDAEYRKFTLASGWTNFVEDGNNQVASARSRNGLCPGPNSGAYRQGLGVFDDCVRLTIEDGGPNDSDGVADGVIRDPGGAAVSDVTPEADDGGEPDDGSGGGLWHPLILLLLSVFGLLAIRRRYL